MFLRDMLHLIMTKVIPLYGFYSTVIKKQRPLSPQMVISLIMACSKQHAGIPFGPKDIRGSFTSLINRGLIIREQSATNDDVKCSWRVTGEAIEILRAMDIAVPSGI